MTNETLERPRRRTFTAEYKLGVLQEADAASAPGAIGELLRREGLYSSHLATWRRERDIGALASLSKRRGPQSRRLAVEKKRVAQLERENERLRHRLIKDGPGSRQVQLNGVAVALEDLAERLQQVPKETLLLVTGDAKTPYEQVARILNRVRQARVKGVQLVLRAAAPGERRW